MRHVMSTIHERVTRTLVDRLLDDPEYVTLLVEFRKRLQDPSQVALRMFGEDICQTHGSHYTREPKLYDIYCIMEAWVLLHRGALVIQRFYIGTSPEPDVAVEVNEATLRQALGPLGVRVVVTNEKHRGDDGCLSWETPLSFNRAQVDLETGVERNDTLDISSFSVPLEIGTTRGWTTRNHLVTRCGVARWPYDSDGVTILYLAENPWRWPGVDHPPVQPPPILCRRPSPTPETP